MEPGRPIADEIVLDLLNTRPLDRGDLYETRDGHVRLGATLARLRGGQAPWQTGPAAGDESADARSRGRVRAGFEVCSRKRPQQE
jgi:hypothetical protein